MCSLNRRNFLLLIGTLIIVIVIAVVLIVTLRDRESEIIINTATGNVRGKYIENEISDFYAFFSIPYAKPPIGNLRFKSPEPIDAWEGNHDGREEGPACYQQGRNEATISEDCLTLHVYTPGFSQDLKPVYFYLHGGALARGSGEFREYGPHYFIQHDLVVVLPQTRLDIFGYLNLNSADAPGNMGLADAIEALRWTRANIEKFGGDPNKITIGGMSSGGIMVHALTLSPQAQGLFHGSIMQSGTTLSYRFFTENVDLPIRQIKEQVGMPNATNEQLLQHLISLGSSDLATIRDVISNSYPTLYAAYNPCVITRDVNGIIPTNPLELIRQNNYSHVPMLVGFTSDEGIRLEPFMDRLHMVNENFNMVVPTDLFPIDDTSLEKNETAQVIKQYYFGDLELSEDTFSEYVKLCTDSWYGHITDYMLRLQSNLIYSAPIYYYVFAVDGAYNHQKIRENISSPGANHGDCEGYLWKKEVLSNIQPDDDFSDLARERMVAMWANFIKYGDPVPEIDSLLPVKWEQIDYPQMNYLLINRTLSIHQAPYRERLLFWQKLYGFTEI